MGAKICKEDPDEDMRDSFRRSSFKGSARTDSIFKDMGSKKAMGQRFGYEQEYAIGPYFQDLDTQKLNKKKIKAWEKLAKKANQKKVRGSIKRADSQFIVNKIDTMLYEIQQSNIQSFMKGMLDGPPMTLRWGIWKTQLHENVKFEIGLYERLIEDLENNPSYDQIRKDIIRTFPNQLYFSHSGIQGASLGHQQLHRVLGAISKYFPNSYCQSMNFILGFLILISGGNEIDVFHGFVSLVKNKKFLIIGLYEEGLPLLRFLEFVTNKLMIRYIPEIKDKFDELMVPNGFWLVKWYMTMFIYAFPINICIRIWDYVLAKGIFGLVYIIIPILLNFEYYLISMEDLEEVEIFQDITRQEKYLEDKKSEYYMNMTKIIKDSEKYELSNEEIQQFAYDFIAENQNIENEYVTLFTQYADENKFSKLVKDHMEPKIYTHPSQYNTMIDSRNNSQISSKNQSSQDLKELSITEAVNLLDEKTKIDNNKQQQQQKQQQTKKSIEIEIQTASSKNSKVSNNESQ